MCEESQKTKEEDGMMRDRGAEEKEH